MATETITKLNTTENQTRTKSHILIL